MVIHAKGRTAKNRCNGSYTVSGIQFINEKYRKNEVQKSKIENQRLLRYARNDVAIVCIFAKRRHIENNRSKRRNYQCRKSGRKRPFCADNYFAPRVE